MFLLKYVLAFYNLDYNSRYIWVILSLYHNVVMECFDEKTIKGIETTQALL